MPRTVSYLTIPAGSAASQCRSCRQAIYWALHPRTNKKHPVSVKDAGALLPTREMDGRGISHFADCPNAQQHRKARP